MRLLKTILTAFTMGFCVSAWADSYAYLTVNTTSGASDYEISSISKITFDAQSMILWNGDTQLGSLPLATLEKMRFSDSPAGISALELAPRTRVSGDVLYVSAESGSRITLFNMRGMTVKEVTASASETEISLRALPKGVYVVKVNDTATKLMNKSGR